MRLFVVLPIWPERERRARACWPESAPCAAVCTCLLTGEQNSCSWVFPEQPQLGSDCSSPPRSQRSFSSRSGSMSKPRAPSMSVLFTAQEELTWLENRLCAMLLACIISFCLHHNATWYVLHLTDEDTGSERGEEINSYWCNKDYKWHASRRCSSVWTEDLV